MMLSDNVSSNPLTDGLGSLQLKLKLKKFLVDPHKMRTNWQVNSWPQNVVLKIFSLIYMLIASGQGGQMANF